MGQSWSALSKGQALHKAIREGDDDTVSQVVNECPQAVLHKTLFRRRCCLHIACARGATLQVATLLFGAHQVLQDGPDLYSFINDADTSGNTPLIFASKSGHTNCVRMLLEEGANPLLANRRRYTPLHVASQRGHSSCCHLLLTARVRNMEGGTSRAAGVMVPDLIGDERYIDVHNKAGFAPLHLAVLAGDLETVSVLIQMGASLDGPVLRNLSLSNSPYLCGGSTALHIAAGQGNIPICRLLLEAQRRHPAHDLRRIRNMAGLTPLNMALLSGHTEVVRALVTIPRAGRESRTPASLRTIFPPVLRQHMLALLDRATLLLQLREIAKVWKAQGLSRAGDAVVSSVPWTLGALSPTRVAQLRVLLQREEVYLGEVVAGLEEALRLGPPENPPVVEEEAPPSGSTLTATDLAVAAAVNGYGSGGSMSAATSIAATPGQPSLASSMSDGNEPGNEPEEQQMGGRQDNATSADAGATTPPYGIPRMYASPSSTPPRTPGPPESMMAPSDSPPLPLPQSGRWQAALQALANPVVLPPPTLYNTTSTYAYTGGAMSSRGRATGVNGRRRRASRSAGGGSGDGAGGPSDPWLRRRQRMQGALWELVGLTATQGDALSSAHDVSTTADAAALEDSEQSVFGVDDQEAESDEDVGEDGCQICMESVPDEVSVQSCGHGMCFACACKLCGRMSGEPISCPFCRGSIQSFVAIPECRSRLKERHQKNKNQGDGVAQEPIESMKIGNKEVSNASNNSWVA